MINRLNIDVDKIKASIDDSHRYRLSCVNDRSMTDNRCKVWLRIVRLFVDRSVIDAADINMGDLPEVDSSISVQSVKKEIETCTRKLLENQEKYAKLLKRKSSVSGLYHQIIQAVIFKEFLLLRVVDAFYGLSLLGCCLSHTYVLTPMLLSKEFPNIWKPELAALMIFNVTSLTIPTVLRKLEAKLLIKVRMCLQQLIYDKLLMSDSFFLDTADNNLMHRLLYSDLNDYVKLTLAGRFVVPFSVILGGIAVSMSVHFHVTLLVVFIHLTITLGFSILTNTIMQRRYEAYTSTVLSIRKLIYELIVNFKSFTLKSLKQRYTCTLDRLTTMKVSKLSALLVLSKIDPVEGRRNFTYLLVADAVVKYCAWYYNFPMVHLTLEWYLPMLAMYSMLHTMYKLYMTSNFTAYRSSASRSLFDAFFDSDSVVACQSGIDHCNQGQISFDMCDVLQRENDGVGLMLKRSVYAQSRIDFVSLGDIKRQYEESGKSQAVLRSMHSRFQRLIKSENAEELHKFKLVCSKLTLDILPGSRVCLFDNSKSNSVKGMINAIMQENYISSGSLQVRGSISYLNTKKFNFLVGKTIRDNILFGQEFDQARYDGVLRNLNVTFSNYHGQDFYQVTEEGENIRADDKRNILIARFLYYQSDIYIIEEYLIDLNLTLHGKQLRSLFDNTLRGKTVVYVANKFEAIQLSDILVCFDRDSRMHAVQTKQFLESYDVTVQPRKRLWSIHEFPQMKDSGYETLQIRMKNCIFVANLSYQEELVIYKKMQRQKEHISKMKENTNDVLDFLAYGIFLADKRRSLGQYLDDDFNQFNFKQIVELLKGLIKRKILTAQHLTVISMFYVSQMAFVLVAEYLAFRMTYDIILERTDRLFRVRFVSSLIVAFVIIGKILEICRKRYVQKHFLEKIRMLNKTIQTSILDSDISQILNKRSHRVLDTVSNDLSTLEVTCLPILKQIYEDILAAVVSIFVLIIVTSLWGIPIFMASIYLSYSFFKSILPVYYSSTKLHSFIDYKIDDLNFQLLNIVASMRRAGKLPCLSKSLQNLANNYARCRKLTEVQFATAIRLMALTISFLSMSCILGIILLCSHFPSLNWFKISNSGFCLSVLYASRLFLIQLDIPNSIKSLMDISKVIVKLATFVNKQQSIIEQGSGSLKKIDYSQPIVFKRVSVTIGMQPVFKKISFKIDVGSKVGVLGIDGAGRSVLFELITKVMQADSTDRSEISIFGWQLEEVSEKIIKENMFVLERSPVLFEGTIRENLDPYAEFTDEEIIAKLKELKIAKILLRAEMIQSRADIANKDRLFVKSRVAIFDLIKKSSMEPNRNMTDLIRSNSSHFFQRIDSRNQERSLSSPKKSLFSKFKSLKVDLNKKSQDRAQPQRITRKSQGLSVISKSRIIKLKKHKTEKVSPRDEQKYHSPRPENQKAWININSQEKTPVTSPRPVPESRPAGHSEQRDQGAGNNAEEGDSVKTLKKVTTHRPCAESLASSDRLIELSGKQSSKSDVEGPLSIEELSIGQSRDREPNLQSPMLSRDMSNRQSPTADESEAFIRSAVQQASMDTHILERDKFQNKAYFNSPEEGSPSSMARRNELSDKNFQAFLDKSVGFRGNNIEKEVRKLINLTRAIITKPKILLLYEEALNFGEGINWNLERLSAELKESTIVSITKNNGNLLFYDKILFLDAGRVIEKGDPKKLVSLKDSYLHRYLNEVDPSTLELLKEAQANPRSANSKSNLLKMNFAPQRDLCNPARRRACSIDEPLRQFDVSSKKVDQSALSNSVIQLVPLELKDRPTEVKNRKDVAVMIEPRLADYSRATDAQREDADSLEWDRNIDEFEKNSDLKGPSTESQHVSLPPMKPINLITSCIDQYSPPIPEDPPTELFSKGMLEKRLPYLDQSRPSGNLMTIPEISEMLDTPSVMVRFSRVESNDAKKYRHVQKSLSDLIQEESEE